MIDEKPLSEAVMSKIFELLDRVKEVEEDNRDLRRRLLNLETMQALPILVPDSNPDDWEPLTEEQKRVAKILGVSLEDYHKVLTQQKLEDQAAEKAQVDIQKALMEAQSQAIRQRAIPTPLGQQFVGDKSSGSGSALGGIGEAIRQAKGLIGK